MKKSLTTYTERLNGTDYETLTIVVNEEVADDIQIAFDYERWRTKAETIKVLLDVIDKIKELT